MEEDLRAKRDRVIECLRYFYDCFPLTKRGARERSERLHTTLVAQLEDLKTVQRSLPKDEPEMSVLVMRLVSPLIEMLSAASHRYTTEVKKSAVEK